MNDAENVYHQNVMYAKHRVGLLFLLFPNVRTLTPFIQTKYNIRTTNTTFG